MPKHKEWLAITDDDINMAILLKDAEYYNGSIYHCQQAAEKALKGFLVFNKKPVQKTHDLMLLCEECEQIDASFKQIIYFARLLKPYSTRNRYPDDYVELEKSEVESAIQAAVTIINFVKDKLI